VRLGAGDRVLVVLHPEANRPVVERHTGLYHLAIHVPTRQDLARLILRLFAASYPNYPTDHTATETTYLSDPDGNGIEVTFETPERGRLVMSPSGQPAAQDAQGNFVSPTVGLDLNRVLGVLKKNEPLDVPVGAATRVGHIHLRVADIDPAMRFYRDLIGFEEQWYSPRVRMADVNLPNYVPHVIAFNTWESQGAGQAPEGYSGLRYFTIELANEDDLAAVRSRLDAAGVPVTGTPEGFFTSDPSGNRIVLTLAK